MYTGLTVIKVIKNILKSKKILSLPVNKNILYFLEPGRFDRQDRDNVRERIGRRWRSFYALFVRLIL